MPTVIRERPVSGAQLPGHRDRRQRRRQRRQRFVQRDQRARARDQGDRVPQRQRGQHGPQDHRAEEVHQPHVQARVDRRRRVLELDQEGPRRTGPTRRGLDHPPGREQGRGDALELLARLAVQVHGPDLQRGEQRDRDGVRGDLRRRARTWTRDMSVATLPGYRVVTAAQPPREEGLRNDVACFVGSTVRGPLGVPVQSAGTPGVRRDLRWLGIGHRATGVRGVRRERW